MGIGKRKARMEFDKGVREFCDIHAREHRHLPRRRFVVGAVAGCFGEMRFRQSQKPHFAVHAFDKGFHAPRDIIGERVGRVVSRTHVEAG